MYRATSQLSSRGACHCGLVAMSAALLFLAVCAPANAKPSDDSADVNAIRANIDAYVAAYNRGDAKAVAAYWSDTAEWISPSGERFEGKQAIERELQTLFAENKGVRIEVIRPSIRLISPDVAVEEGTVRVLRPEEPANDSTYLAVDVKKNGQWKLDTVRETEVPEAAPTASPLQDLAWLVGEWTDAGGQAIGATAVKWTKNNSFLSYSFKVSPPGMDDLEGTLIIGWDPAAGTIRSWMFDSDGGFGEGAWSKKGNSWVVKFHQVLPDGRKASATNIYTIVDNNTFMWKSVGREVDGQYLPNVDEVKMVRKTADSMKEAHKPAKPAGIRGMKK